MTVKVNRLIIKNNHLIEKFYDSFDSVEEADYNLNKLNRKTSKKGLEVYKLLASKKDNKALINFMKKKKVIIIKYIFIDNCLNK